MNRSLWLAIYEDDTLDPALFPDVPFDYDPHEEAPVERDEDEDWRIGGADFESHYTGVVRVERAEPSPRFL